jgi:hypothetical protein
MFNIDFFHTPFIGFPVQAGFLTRQGLINREVPEEAGRSVKDQKEMRG